MAKKTKKGGPAKKIAKPTKKVAAKKTAPKKVAKHVKKSVAKKAAPKKSVKPVKKAVAKKIVKKVVVKKATKSAKKAIAKKTVTKITVKKTAPKKILKKVASPAKKMPATKVVKPIAKSITKATPVKQAAKIVQKPVAEVAAKKALPLKPVAVVQSIPSDVKKVEPTLKRKQRDSDDDYSSDEAPMVVEYQTPSIRKPMGPEPKPHINTDTRTRYSDSELKEFKELILKKLEEAQKDFELLKSTLSHKDDHGTDDTSPTFKLLEDGSDVLSKEETSHLANRQEKFIQNLQNALIRIENKTYGVCRATGKLISKERLRSVPHATLAIEAKLEQSN